MSTDIGVVERAISSLGKGLDFTSDFRLKYFKGKERLVLLNQTEKKELSVPGFGSIKDVSVDIKCDKGDRVRYQSDVLEFRQMVESFNQACLVPGKIPSGLFNAMFGFESGSWARDAANTKYLAVDGYFIVLFNVHIHRYPLLLSDDVRKAVPNSWDPCALARFIEKYGTHIIVGLGFGGQDVVLVKQDKSSSLGPSQLKKHLDDLGDQLFTGTCTFSSKINKDQKYKQLPRAFNVFDPQPVTFNSFSSITSKDGITVTLAKRGGDPTAISHHEWLPTVSTMPDAIQFNFIPITSLLKDVPGNGFLSHAINLYLRYKPPISDLQYFLDFQTSKMWAPIHNDLPLGPTTNRATSSPALHFNLMGPKLFVNTTQVTVGKRPVTGMRLFLEGMKCNRLAIHLEHLVNTPTLIENKIGDTQLWRGSEEIADARYFEGVSGKKFSHICTIPVRYDPNWTTRANVAYIVTGAQLHTKKHDSKTVLHLRLLFSNVSNCFVAQSNWMQMSSEFSQKSGIFSAISTSLTGNLAVKEKEEKVVVDSSVYPSGPPMPIQTQKLLKFVDTSELRRGPQDSPGHWLVTGARLDLEKGKICLQVKFSLLNICS
ncbi:MACPF domain-containing protein At1g14780 isoform X2 [Tripterygium wilfordii]|uniref:MACPF domain-containing protein At1g14780 isoform X2 n=1 Tax=Tripterygium wilfordii TaxID=458696 RepID=UPI0018F855EA|nr:MACPF domain-containing protein At1g14780 isoform X2 [Tripterygium wilfordii]